MKRFFGILLFLVFVVTAFAQTPEEIIGRMDSVMKQHKDDGVAMTMEMKIPIIGTVSSRTYTLGEKYRIEIAKDDNETISWRDGNTEWTYDSSKNEVEIKNKEAKIESNENSDLAMFENVTKGYNVTLTDETADSWKFRCRRSRSNPDKDAPKKMYLEVAKGTYMPMSISAKTTGFTITMKDISYDVTEKQVTFDPKDYPNVKIIDNR